VHLSGHAIRILLVFTVMSSRRAWLSGARLLAVRHEDVPGGGDIAGTLRYAPTA